MVLLTNSSESVDDIGMHLLDESVPLRSIAPRPTVAMTAAQLQPFVGEYALAPTFVLTVTREGDKLFTQATNQSRFRLWPAPDGSFALRAGAASVRFERDSAGRVQTLILAQNGRSQAAARR